MKNRLQHLEYLLSKTSNAVIRQVIKKKIAELKAE
jgi:predicted DNA-binding protein